MGKNKKKRFLNKELRVNSMICLTKFISPFIIYLQNKINLIFWIIQAYTNMKVSILDNENKKIFLIFRNKYFLTNRQFY